MTSALDARTRAYVIEAITEGREVHRCPQTGAIIPPFLRGTLFSQRDLLASKFAEIDATFMAKKSGLRVSAQSEAA